MMQSMTGFGSASAGGFTVEIRSLNHRFMDISMRMPAFMTRHEFTLRNMLKKRFQRGRFDVTITPPEKGEKSLVVDRKLARKLYQSLKELQTELDLHGEIDINVLAGFNHIIVEEERECSIEELFKAFEEATAGLEEMRKMEGCLLREDMRQKVSLLQEMNEKIRVRAPMEMETWRDRLLSRIKMLSETEADNGRVLQEVALMAEKLDVAEEIDRIGSHLSQFNGILENEYVVGKKLDFLLQELNREINTLGSKSADYHISQLVIEMKSEVEKIREQVQNLQ
jgi:uncharacterized protein (TIGR00255 family)